MGRVLLEGKRKEARACMTGGKEQQQGPMLQEERKTAIMGVTMAAKRKGGDEDLAKGGKGVKKGETPTGRKGGQSYRCVEEKGDSKEFAPTKEKKKPWGSTACVRISMKGRRDRFRISVPRRRKDSRGTYLRRKGKRRGSSGERNQIPCSEWKKGKVTITPSREKRAGEK